MVDELEQVSTGVYRTTEPIPVHGNWKTTIRLHQGTALQGLPVYFPRDPAIPVEEIPARPRFAREFVLDKELLQREQKGDVSGALVAFAYLSVLAIGLGLVASIAWGLRLLGQRIGARRPERPAAQAAGSGPPA